MNYTISLDQDQLKLLIDHIHEMSDPGRHFMEILSILEAVVEVSTKFFGRVMLRTDLLVDWNSGSSHSPANG
jgi:hypothetical protein